MAFSLTDFSTSYDQDMNQEIEMKHLEEIVIEKGKLTFPFSITISVTTPYH